MTEQEVRILENFFNVAKIQSIEEYGDGHINCTYLVRSKYCRFIIQKINKSVFHNPPAIIHNIGLVTNFIRNQLIYNGKNPENAVLTCIQTVKGDDYAIIDGEYWRGYMFINGALAHSKCDDAKMFREVGKVVGDFQFLLKGFDPTVLLESIPHFHDTPYRFKHFINTVSNNLNDLNKNALKEIEFIKEREDIMSCITSLLSSGELPQRVTHNDTKLSNVMIDEKTNKAVCLIDFDTVMNGSLLYDYGDALRAGASTASEDETDLSKVHVNLELFTSFTDGFLKRIKPIIKYNEVNNLYYGFLIMTLEVGMRFLDDYLDGDCYFKVSYSTHNLDRARNQLALVKDIEERKEEIIEIINSILVKYKYTYTI